MKKLLAILCLLCLLTGCTNRYEEGYQLGYEEGFDAGQKNVVDAKISGEFTATVRQLIPDYCLDNVTETAALVTLFQSGPFVLFVGQEMAQELEVGQTYVFTVEETVINGIPYAEAVTSYVDPEIALRKHAVWNFQYRIAETEDCGLDSVHLKYEIIE